MNLIYENNADRFLFSTSQNMTFPSHMHTGIELLYLEEGSIETTVGTCTRMMRPGELALAFPHQIHSYYTDPNGPGSFGIMVLCPAETGGEFLSALLRSHPADPFLSGDAVHPDIPYAMRSLLRTPPDRPDHLPVIRAYIQLLLSRAFPCMDLVKNKDSQPPGSTAQLIAFLSEHYTEPVNLDMLSAQLGISKYSVSRIFSEKMHTSFSRYLNTLRIDYAKHLLQEGSIDILTVSEMCGYDNPRTFNREFKALCGCRPREYRRGAVKA